MVYSTLSLDGTPDDGSFQMNMGVRISTHDMRAASYDISLCYTSLLNAFISQI